MHAFSADHLHIVYGYNSIGHEKNGDIQDVVRSRNGTRAKRKSTNRETLHRKLKIGKYESI